MTDNMDEFDQDQFETADEQPEHVAETRDLKQTVADAWRNKPLFKLIVIMGVVSFAMAGALGAFSSAPAPDKAHLAEAPKLQEAPGGKASPFFIEQNKQANEERVDKAIQQGGSAIPTPVGSDVDLSELTEKAKKDPLLEFRAETERLKQELRAEQKQNTQQVQMLQQQMRQKPVEEDDTLARAMQKQMQDLMQSWVPHKITTVAGVAEEKQVAGAATASVPSGVQMASVEADQTVTPAKRKLAKAVIPAGTVNYAQLLTEANSDVPGPIMVQLLSGPLAGGRAIGQFQVANDYLVLTFNHVSYKGEDYSINAIALDPDTTLGGMATEVDHRYFTRLVLPAAASFMSAFGSALSEGKSDTTVTGDTVIVSQADKGYKDALYSGLGQMGQTMSQFLQNEASATKPLIRVGVGTPMGLFFLQPVHKPGEEETEEDKTAATLQEWLARNYQQKQNNNLTPLQQMQLLQQMQGNSGYGTSGYGTSGYGTTGYDASTIGGLPSAAPTGSARVLAPGAAYKAGNTTIYTTR